MRVIFITAQTDIFNGIVMKVGQIISRLTTQAVYSHSGIHIQCSSDYFPKKIFVY